MKIPLVGQSYALRSPAAAAQQTMNVFPQFIDDPNEQGKNKGILVGCPGFHLMGNADQLAGTANNQFRGFLSGGGRLFAVTDGAVLSSLWELGLGTYVGGNPSTGGAALVSRNDLTGSTPDGKPGQMFGNGNQLGIIKNGFSTSTTAPDPRSRASSCPGRSRPLPPEREPAPSPGYRAISSPRP